MEFSNLLEGVRMFSDEDFCQKYIAQVRWKGKLTCPYCNYDQKVYSIELGKRYKCGNDQCHRKFSVKVGTVLQDSNLKLSVWLTALYLLTSNKKGISSIQLGKYLGITQKSAWFLAHRIRQILKPKAPYLLKTVVQADETYVGGKNKNRHSNKKVPRSQGRSFKDKTPVLGVLEVKGKINVQVVPNVQAATIQPILESYVKEGAIIISDEWHAYRDLPDKYHHIVINHGEHEYVRGAFDTNSVENFWSHFKRGIIGIYHYTSRKHLQRYCDEFAYRFNNRGLTNGQKFESILSNSIGQRLKYSDLIAKT